MVYGLSFISDNDLFEHVKATVQKYRFSIDLNGFNSNIIDPIKLTFDSRVYNKTIHDVVESEILRQIDKSNTNHIGYFHQNIFEYIGDGWEVLKSGYDVVNTKKAIFVEIKNKHNTMNSSSSQKTYMKMQGTILENDEAVCLLVEVIAKNSQDKKWEISIDNKKMSHKNIRRVSMDKFYQIVTGNPYAFRDLCIALPRVIDDVISQMSIENYKNTVFDELKDISPDILKSLYYLSFKKYEGFEDFYGVK